MTSAITFALAYAGLTALSLAFERHYRAVWGRAPSALTARSLRGVGFGLLALSVLPSVASWPGSIGLVAWFGFVTAASLPLIFLLPYAPRVAAGLAVIAPTVVALLWLVTL